jgi:hypothetical protein
MPQPKTAGRDRKTSDYNTRDRKPRKTTAGPATEGKAATSSQARAQSGTALEGMLVESLLCDLNKARQLAFNKGRAVAALTATLAMRRLLLLLPDNSGSPSSLQKRFPLVWKRALARSPGKARRGRA